MPSYPAAPWNMHGQMWLSVFSVREGERSGHPAGKYGVGLVRYEDPSPLTYSELLVARPVKGAVTITDIWVDSAESMAGGRELWAIPKELCDFAFETSRTGPLSRTTWSAGLGPRPIVEARFTDASRFAVRVPFKGRTEQPGIDGGPDLSATLTGSAKTLPCRSHWSFDANGPLAWLAGKRPVASVRMSDFRMSFG